MPLPELNAYIYSFPPSRASSQSILSAAARFALASAASLSASRRRSAPLGPSTTLLILSDTKTIDIPRAARSLAEARRQAGKVLWLNPIPERKWPYVRSIQTMAMLCQMLPCSTLDELARACRKMLK